eukprot:7148043-Prymnesium_polylepis.1
MAARRAASAAGRRTVADPVAPHSTSSTSVPTLRWRRATAFAREHDTRTHAHTPTGLMFGHSLGCLGGSAIRSGRARSWPPRCTPSQGGK